MKTIVVDVDGIIDNAPVQGQMTVRYFDASNWVITSIGIDLFADDNNKSSDVREILKEISSRFESKIEAAIKDNENGTLGNR